MELQFLRNSDLHEQIENGYLPQSLNEMKGDIEYPQPKGSGAKLEEDGVVEWAWMSAAGYGDPLDREPERVKQDVIAGRITEKYALDEYGVVLENREVNQSATQERRESLRRERLDEARMDFSDLIRGKNS